MRSFNLSRVAGVVALAACGALLGASCGGSGGTVKYTQIAVQGTSVCDPSAGGCQTAGSNTNCGGAGQCPCTTGAPDDSCDPSKGACTKSSMAYCGICPSAIPPDQCIYCPNGYLCPSDPCTKPLCAPPLSGGDRCPVGIPVDCGVAADGYAYCCPYDTACSQGKCCPSDHPLYCPNIGQCAVDSSGCTASASTTCGSDWQGSGCAKGGKVASGLKTVGCCTQDSCGLACADCNGNAWWEYKGAIYATAAAFTKACNP